MACYLSWFIPELPEVGSGFLRRSLMFAIVRVVLVEPLENSLMFAIGYC